MRAIQFQLIKIKRFLRYLIFAITDRLVFSRPKIRPKTLLIIQVQAIGDYVIFRNFLESIKANPKYTDYQITLLGNSLWKSISEYLDRGIVDKFLWLDRIPFVNNPLYRIRKIKEIVGNSYEKVFVPNFSRERFYEDWLVRCIRASEKIAVRGDMENMSRRDFRNSEKIYHSFIEIDSEIRFEFDRYKEVFKQILASQESLPIKPALSLPEEIEMPEVSKPYALVFIGASANFRKWPPEYFAQVALHLNEKKGLEIVLAGGPAEVSDSRLFQRNFKGSFVNFVGRTSLVDLLHLISSSEFVLSNETSVPHISQAMAVKKTVVISNGNHFGRFIPYPASIGKNYIAIFPDEIEDRIDRFEELCKEYGGGSNLDIKGITVDKVLETINKSLRDEI